MITLAIIAALLLAFANGANDNFKGVATLYGSRTTSYRTALIWGTATTLLGSLLAVMLASELLQRFSGKGLVPEIAANDVRQRQLDFDARIQQARHHSAPEPTADFVLVDARSLEETQVSIIPKALTVGQFEAQREAFRQRVVICYCTIGVRSEEYAHHLREAGFNAWNFRGSILEWCQRQYPLETLDGQPTRRVHT